MLTVTISGKKLTGAQVLYLRKLLLVFFNACSNTINDGANDVAMQSVRQYRSLSHRLICVLEDEISPHSCEDNVSFKGELIIVVNAVCLGALYGTVVKLALGQSRTIRNKAAKGLPAREIDHMDGFIKRLL